MEQVTSHALIALVVSCFLHIPSLRFIKGVGMASRNILISNGKKETTIKFQNIKKELGLYTFLSFIHLVNSPWCLHRNGCTHALPCVEQGGWTNPCQEFFLDCDSHYASPSFFEFHFHFQ